MNLRNFSENGTIWRLGRGSGSGEVLAEPARNEEMARIWVESGLESAKTGRARRLKGKNGSILYENEEKYMKMERFALPCGFWSVSG
ncbi:MAG: hypothetical protein HXX08_12830 [Chloroflexi bacterium]|uniref:Uncharacterized protein n=1 Tax=Candidatus Chlorohelix allophototropha TaxID=3003348 RepID=A0A8T7M3V1_9CHLR|nr:hypothetical protein [Chloroflexota bacterium]WJW69980.1 hypothetical protein OZ401_004781 [Chloroflexota bacterium L227-S17]